MLEIERKFLVRNTSWGEPVSSRRIEQGYLFIAADRTMRIRRSDGTYTLTLKVQAEGIARHEIEMEIGSGQGQTMLDGLCVEPPIRKTRHIVIHENRTWEIDVFDGDNAGLIVAEIELTSEDDAFDRPFWVGPEVTDDSRFFNAALSRTPFSKWGKSYAELLAEKTGD